MLPSRSAAAPRAAAPSTPPAVRATWLFACRAAIAARIHATSGMGKVIVDSRFSKIDGNTYQSPDYDVAADKVEITVNSGAGNVSVNTK